LNTAPNINQAATADLALEPLDNERLANLCGPLDQHLRHIERRLGVEINNRGHHFKIIGAPKSVETTGRLLTNLYASTISETLSAERVHLFLQEAKANETLVAADSTNAVLVKIRRGIISGRSPNQRLYLQHIQTHDISFGIGPAGTGKTYLAVVAAVAALEQARAQRIVLVRPAVEAGEKLGYLPGDMAQKVDPYLRPLYDALYELLGFEQVTRHIEKNIIEVAPLAFMRGRF